jgi:hypothetical protein
MNHWLTLSAEKLMFLGGVSVFLLTVLWVRRRDLREKYAVLWLLVSSLLLFCGLFPEIIEGFAQTAHLAYSSAVLYVALGAIYLFSCSVSLSLSHQHRRNIRLTQELALLEARLREVEAGLREQQQCS